MALEGLRDARDAARGDEAKEMFFRIQRQPHQASATSKASENQGQDRAVGKDVVCEGMRGERIFKLSVNLVCFL